MNDHGGKVWAGWVMQEGRISGWAAPPFDPGIWATLDCATSKPEVGLRAVPP